MPNKFVMCRKSEKKRSRRSKRADGHAERRHIPLLECYVISLHHMKTKNLEGKSIFAGPQPGPRSGSIVFSATSYFFCRSVGRTGSSRAIFADDAQHASDRCSRAVVDINAALLIAAVYTLHAFHPNCVFFHTRSRHAHIRVYLITRRECIVGFNEL